MHRYSSTVADHFNAPRNAGQMESADAVGTASLGGRAPYVTIYVRAQGNTVSQAQFQTFGCGFSIAACSALTEMITGAAFEDCLSLTAATLIDALDGMPPHKQFCAGLAIDAMRNAVSELVEA